MRADRKEPRFRRISISCCDRPVTDIGVKDGRIAAIALQGRGFK
jgi:hypothetical protein